MAAPLKTVGRLFVSWNYKYDYRPGADSFAGMRYELQDMEEMHAERLIPETMW